jgi:hypothetical protein
MLIEYNNDKETSEIQTVALDFWGNVKHAQPIIYDRMMKARNAAVAPTTSEAEAKLLTHIGGPFN